MSHKRKFTDRGNLNLPKEAGRLLNGLFDGSCDELSSVSEKSVRICEELMTNPIMIPVWRLFNDLPEQRQTEAVWFFLNTFPYIQGFWNEIGPAGVQQKIDRYETVARCCQILLENLSVAQIFKRGDSLFRYLLACYKKFALGQSWLLQTSTILPHLNKKDGRHNHLFEELKKIRDPDSSVFCDSHDFKSLGEKRGLELYTIRLLRRCFLLWFDLPRLEEIAAVESIIFDRNVSRSAQAISRSTNKMS